jgi:hypothetical protein
MEMAEKQQTIRIIIITKEERKWFFGEVKRRFTGNEAVVCESSCDRRDRRPLVL